MKTVLLPTDFSEVARNAADYALHLFQDSQCRFILVNTYQINASSPEMMAGLSEMLQNNSEQGLQAAEVWLKSHPLASNHSVETISILSDLVIALEKLAENEQADFVVMGTTGASGLSEVLVGSNAASCSRRVPCPVLIVPQNAHFAPLQHIVLAADLKPLKAGVLQPAVDLAKATGAEICAFTVYEHSVVPDVDAAVEGLKLDEHLQGVTHTFEAVVNSDAADGISNYLDAGSADLLVVLSRSESIWDRLFHRSVTKQMACHTKVPMLALHA